MSRAKAPAPQSRASKKATPTLEGKKVFVMSKNPDGFVLNQRALQKLGAEVDMIYPAPDYTGNIPTILRQIKSSMPDIVIIDNVPLDFEGSRSAVEELIAKLKDSTQVVVADTEMTKAVALDLKKKGAIGLNTAKTGPEKFAHEVADGLAQRGRSGRGADS